MNAATIPRTIQPILAPVAMVTTCAILVSGILAHYAVVNERLRSLTHERLDLLRGPTRVLSSARSRVTTNTGASGCRRSIASCRRSRSG